VDEADIETESA